VNNVLLTNDPGIIIADWTIDLVKVVEEAKNENRLANHTDFHLFRYSNR